MFLLASYGADGINLETDLNQLGWISHYSPIVHDAAGQGSARPEYYGMLAFAMAGKGTLLHLNMDKTEFNLSAYATGSEDGSVWLTVINKDLARDTLVQVALPKGYANAAAFRLSAPSIESNAQVTLAGSQVSANGQWRAGLPEKAAVTEGAARVLVPHASAVLLHLSK